MKLDKNRIEKVANAIKFLVPVDGCCGWTAKGLAETKWPKGFSAKERKTIRGIAREALKAVAS